MEGIKQIWPKWEVLEVLGQGGFGTVYKAKRENFGDVSYAAIKVVKIPSNKSEVKEMTGSGLTNEHIKDYYKKSIMNMIDEIKMMSKFKTASHIVSIEDFEVVENNDGIGGTIYIRMELLKNIADHFDFGNINQNEVIKMATDILTALEFCHKQNVVHRDIKPGNIFISEFGEYKLGDFGISREVEKTNATMSQKGTKSYMAPEMIRMEKYGKNVDLYALGLTMYELLNHGRIPFLPPFPEPFYPMDREEAMIKRLMGEEFPDISGIGELNAIIKKACHADPSQRYNDASEMKEALLHLGKTIHEDTREEKESFIFDEKTSQGESLFKEDKPLFEEQSTMGAFNDLPFEKESKPKPKGISIKDVLDYVVTRFNIENKTDLSKDKLAYQRLEDTISKEMNNFNNTGKMVLDLPYLTAGSEGALHLNMTVLKHQLRHNDNQGINEWLFDDKKINTQKQNVNSKNNDNKWNYQESKKEIKHVITCPACGKKAYLQLTGVYACSGCGKWVNGGIDNHTFTTAVNLFESYNKELDNKNYKETLPILIKLSSLVPECAQLYVRRGQVYGSLNQDSLQFNAYKKAVELDDQDAIVHNGLCVVYIKQQNWNKAYEHGKKAYDLMKKGSITRYNNEGVICANYAIALEKVNRSEEAHLRLVEANNYNYANCDTLAVDWKIGNQFYQETINSVIQTYKPKMGMKFHFKKMDLDLARNVLQVQKEAKLIVAVYGDKLFGRAYSFALSDIAVHFYDKKNWYMTYYDLVNYAPSCNGKVVTLFNKKTNSRYDIEVGKNAPLVCDMLKAINSKLIMAGMSSFFTKKK